jgi:actin-like ATPase involved in cell morphogenesis
MAGGSSLLRGLTTVISNATGLDVKLAEDPLTCVARGTAFIWKTWSCGKTRWRATLSRGGLGGRAMTI